MSQDDLFLAKICLIYLPFVILPKGLASPFDRYSGDTLTSGHSVWVCYVGEAPGWKGIPKRVIDWLNRWVQASLWLRDPKKVFTAILLTILIWGVMWLTNLLLFKSLGMPLGGTAAGLVLILVYVGLIPALMPGNIGPFYFFARLAVLPFGILHDQAFLFAVLLHFIVTLPSLLGGITGLLVRPARAVSS